MAKHKGRFSVVGACSGAIAGLVGITPAAGYVSVWLAAVIGFLHIDSRPVWAPFVVSTTQVEEVVEELH